MNMQPFTGLEYLATGSPEYSSLGSPPYDASSPNSFGCSSGASDSCSPTGLINSSKASDLFGSPVLQTASSIDAFMDSHDVAESLLELEKSLSQPLPQQPRQPLSQQPLPQQQPKMKTESSTSKDKPSQSYIALITMAILSTPEKKMLLTDIYQYIMDNFPYYNNKEKAWRNSIRHNLSLNECFLKCGRSMNGKGNFWGIHPACVEDFSRGDYRRRHARRRARRSRVSISTLPESQKHSMPYVPMTGMGEYQTSSYQPYSRTKSYSASASVPYSVPPTVNMFADRSYSRPQTVTCHYKPAVQTVSPPTVSRPAVSPLTVSPPTQSPPTATPASQYAPCSRPTTTTCGSVYGYSTPQQQPLQERYQLPYNMDYYQNGYLNGTPSSYCPSYSYTSQPGYSNSRPAPNQQISLNLNFLQNQQYQ